MMIGWALLLVHVSSEKGPLQPPVLVKIANVGSTIDVAGSRSRPRMYVPLTVGANVNQTPRKLLQVDTGSLALVARRVSMLGLTYGKVAVGMGMAPEQRSFAGTTGRVTRNCTLSAWLVCWVASPTQTANQALNVQLRVTRPVVPA